MNRSMPALCAPLLVMLAACGGGATTPPANNSATEAEQVNSQAQAPETSSVELPPPIVRSPSYRCDDGKALYVDVAKGEGSVLVRDSRSDLPTRLEREGDSGPFKADGTSISGTGQTVQYASPNRPSQACREATG